MQAKKRYILVFVSCAFLAYCYFGGYRLKNVSNRRRGSSSPSIEADTEFSDHLPSFISNGGTSEYLQAIDTELAEKVTKSRWVVENSAASGEQIPVNRVSSLLPSVSLSSVPRSCRMETCFDFSKCYTEFLIYVYPPEPINSLGSAPPISPNYQKIITAIQESRYYTPDPHRACLFVLGIDTLDRDSLSEDYVRNVPSRLARLTNWNNGRNHVIFNLYSGTWPDYVEHSLGFDTGEAILAKASMSIQQMRPGFDISIPLFHKQFPLRAGATGLASDMHFPTDKRYLLAFKGKSSPPNEKRISSLPVVTGDLQQELHNITTGIETEFEKHNRIFENQVHASIAAFERKMLELFDKFRAEQDEKIERLRNATATHLESHKYVEIQKRLNDLETHNCVLQRRLNRSNLIVRGLPKNIKDLKTPIFKIASLCGSSINQSDLGHCAYIHSGKAVLVKLNSVQLRDRIMVNFSKKRFLWLKDIVGGEITSKVHISDHLTSAATKLIAVCKDLRSKNKIIKYKFINYDVPKVKLTFTNNTQKVLNIEQCLKILNNGCVSNELNSENNMYPSGSNGAVLETESVMLSAPFDGDESLTDDQT